jgi:hypothetical protein
VDEEGMSGEEGRSEVEKEGSSDRVGMRVRGQRKYT